MHQSDVTAALHALHQELFSSGDYYKRWEEHADSREAMADDLQMMVETMPESFPADVYDPATIDGLAGDGEPATIDQARVWALDSGTHSILDITGVGDGPGPGTVWPLTESEQVQIFGSAQPSIESIEAARDAACELVEERWTGRHVVGFERGTPAALFFFGFSGD